MEEKEIWKDIEGYEGLYQVSNMGNVRSLNYRGSDKIKILKLKKNRFGYLTTNLTKNKIMKTVKIHRMAAQAFIPNPNNYPQVNHKDEDKANNNISNLEWCDNRYNCNYATHNKRVAEKQSKKVYQYSKDRTLIKVWDSTMECGRNGFDFGHIAACCRGERKTHKGYMWSYNEII